MGPRLPIEKRRTKTVEMKIKNKGWKDERGLRAGDTTWGIGRIDESQTMSLCRSKDPSHPLAEYAISNYQGLSYFKEPFNCSQECFLRMEIRTITEFPFNKQNVALQG